MIEFWGKTGERLGFASLQLLHRATAKKMAVVVNMRHKSNDRSNILVITGIKSETRKRFVNSTVCILSCEKTLNTLTD